MHAAALSRRRVLAGAAATCVPTRVFAQTADRMKVSCAHAGEALHWYPAYVARAAGLFEKEGLDMEWIDVNNGANQAAAILSGSTTMTCSGIEHAIDTGENGGDIVAFAMLFDVYPIQITLSTAAVRKTGIDVSMPIDEKVKRLRGITIGITAAGSGTDQFIRSVLVARHIMPDDVLRLQPVGSPSAVMAAFDRKLIDGFVLSAPYPDMAQASGAGLIVIDAFKGEIPEVKDVPYTAMLTTRRTMKAKPDAIMRTTRALTRAIAYAQENPEETQRKLHQYFKNVDPALFAQFEPVYRRAAARSPVITELQYDRLKAWLKITEPNPPDTPYAHAVDNTDATQAAKELLPARAPT